jgi:hypothetical protein
LKLWGQIVCIHIANRQVMMISEFVAPLVAFFAQVEERYHQQAADIHHLQRRVSRLERPRIPIQGPVGEIGPELVASAVANKQAAPVDLGAVPTATLVAELRQREGVSATVVQTYDEAIIRRTGPAVVMTVID